MDTCISYFKLFRWKKNRPQVKFKHTQITWAYAGVCRKDSERNEINCREREVHMCLHECVAQVRCVCRPRWSRCICENNFHLLQTAVNWKGLCHWIDGEWRVFCIMQNSFVDIQSISWLSSNRRTQTRRWNDAVKTANGDTEWLLEIFNYHTAMWFVRQMWQIITTNVGVARM